MVEAVIRSSGRLTGKEIVIHTAQLPQEPIFAFAEPTGLLCSQRGLLATPSPVSDRTSSKYSSEFSDFP